MIKVDFPGCALYPFLTSEVQSETLTKHVPKDFWFVVTLMGAESISPAACRYIGDLFMITNRLQLAGGLPLAFAMDRSLG